MTKDLQLSGLSPKRRVLSFRPSGSLLLVVMTLVAIVLANSSLRGFYTDILSMPVVLQLGGFNLFEMHGGSTMSLAEFANDVLMVLFFLHVGLEIRRELLVGELSSVRKALFPVVAAIGGMIFPMIFYYAICHTSPGVDGFPIPMATDIAFSLAVLSAVPGVPPALKVFLATLAVADDIGGILVIAIFYSHGLSYFYLLIALGVLLFLYLLGRWGVRMLWVYYLGLIVLWYFLLRAGIHTTIAGVAVALVVPASSHYRTKEMVELIRSRLMLFPSDKQQLSRSGAVAMLPRQQLLVAESIQKVAAEAVSPVQRMEYQLASLVTFFVLPLFAFVNGGISFGNFSLSKVGSVPFAIIVALFFGKPIGIYLFSRLYLIATRSKMPVWMNRIELLGVGMICGIGFTVSLFIATLSFPEYPQILNGAKVGIFAGSLLAGLAGYLFLTLHYKLKAKRDNARG